MRVLTDLSDRGKNDPEIGMSHVNSQIKLNKILKI